MKLIYVQIAIVLVVAIYSVESKPCHVGIGCGCGGKGLLKEKLLGHLEALKGPCGHKLPCGCGLGIKPPCGCGKPNCGCGKPLLSHCGIKGLICKELYGGTSCPFCHGTGCTTCHNNIVVGKTYPYAPPATLPPVVLPPTCVSPVVIPPKTLPPVVYAPPTTYKYVPPTVLPAPAPVHAKPCDIIVNVINPKAPAAPVVPVAEPVYPIVLPPAHAPKHCL